MLLAPRQLAGLRRRLLGWYRANRRDLPWRRHRDPYRIWLAEIMLQQTRIAAALPYHRKFLRRFPSLGTLARASESEVLKSWSGLGYYSRARNLHRAAKELIARHGGRFPRELDPALALPGIGRYTAAAILSIAYDVPLAALDGNAARVLARLRAVRGQLRQPRRWRRLEQAAQELLPLNAPGDWNQAMMELGETICTPRAPRCSLCPIARWCRARALGIAGELPPARRKQRTVRVRIAAAILLDAAGRVLLVRNPGRQEGALFSRMWQFPAIQVAQDAAGELARHLRETLAVSADGLLALPSARHAVTHRQITLLPFLGRVRRIPAGRSRRSIPLARLERLPISSATRKVALAAIEFLTR